MLRLAIFSDIHGNPLALDAVLDDINRRGGVDEYWILGDLVAIGYDPVAVMDRLAELDNAFYVRGNTDRHVSTDEARGLDAGSYNDDEVQRIVNLARAMAWTRGALSSAGYLDWLAELPLELRRDLPDGSRFLGIHASPGNDDGSGVHPGLSNTELSAVLDGAGAELLCVGHTHWPMELRRPDLHVINLGSVSNPLAPDLRAKYILLEADGDGYRAERCFVDYDREEVIAALKAIRPPMADFLITLFQGEVKPRWQD